MTKVGIFIPSLERGGVERNIIYLSRGLIERGFDVDVLVASAADVFFKQLPDSARIVKLNSRLMPPRLGGLFSDRLRLAISIMPSFLSYLRRGQPAAIISFQSSVLAVWAKILSRSNARLIVRESNTPSVATAGNNHWFSRLVPFLKRCSYPRAEAIVAVSEGAANDLAQTIGISRDRIHVVYNPAFDDSILEKGAEPVDHKWFTSGQPPVILGVGRLTHQKDFGTLLRAFVLIRKEIPARLMIIGEGSEHRQLELLAVQLGLEQDITFQGFQINPYKYMAKASVFVLSSLYEGLPNVLIEALALGTPVVSTDCLSGPREILLDGAGGPLVPVGDFRALAREVLRLLRDKDLAMRFVREGQKRIGRFRSARAIKQYVQLLDADYD